MPEKIIQKLSQAQNFYNQGNLEQSQNVLTGLLKTHPDNFQVQFLSGLVFASIEKYQQAITHFNHSIPLNTNKENSLNIHLNIAQCFLLLADVQSAISEYQQNLELQKHHLSSWVGLAECYTRLGNKMDACAAYQQVIDLSDINVDYHIKSVAYLAIADLNQGISDSNSKFTVRLLEQLIQDIKLCRDKMALSNLFFAKAKIYERQTNYELAYNHYQKGNVLKSQLLNYSFTPVHKESKKLMRFFDRSTLEKIEIQSFTEKAPIFIVGLPRSNSTLIESLLNCSDKTTALGETNIIPELVQKLNVNNRYPDILSHLNQNDYNQCFEFLRNNYQLNNAEIIIDKLPANFWNIGLIKLLFPKSKIIHCYKPPIDACVSLFRQNFLEGHPYSYSLKDSADYYDLHLELMDHWKKLFPDQIHSMNYLDFISNPKKQAIQLFEYCQLPWNSEFLSKYKERSNVTTASSFQVRSEIHSSSSTQVQNYLPYLEYLTRRYPISV